VPVDQLQHVNIRCADVHRSRDFYANVLGLREGERPPFPSAGYWLYVGAVPVIHLVQRTTAASDAAGSGAIDHVAFHGVDLAATRARLQAASLPFREAVVPRDGTVQFFVHDPDGVKIELNFDAGNP
jgi:catechol 2,3-dioxygenase-like lactoylglutathione lyase family enzyme